MKEYIPYILTALNVLGFWLKFIFDEKRARRKERAEREKQEAQGVENGAYPPRKDKHRKR